MRMLESDAYVPLRASDSESSHARLWHGMQVVRYIYISYVMYALRAFVPEYYLLDFRPSDSSGRSAALAPCRPPSVSSVGVSPYSVKNVRLTGGRKEVVHGTNSATPELSVSARDRILAPTPHPIPPWDPHYVLIITADHGGAGKCVVRSQGTRISAHTYNRLLR